MFNPHSRSAFYRYFRSTGSASTFRSGSAFHGRSRSAFHDGSQTNANGSSHGFNGSSRRNFGSCSSGTKSGFNREEYFNQNPFRNTASYRSTLKADFPREYALFNSIDRDDDGIIKRKEIENLCEKFGVPEIADELMNVFGTEEVTFKEFLEHFAALRMLRITARLKMWNNCLGIGVAGNVAGHMEQAGEADKKDDSHNTNEFDKNWATKKSKNEFLFRASHEIKTKPTPAALFPFFIPNSDKILKTKKDHLSPKLIEMLERLRVFPVTNKVIDYPKLGGNVQVEPEMAVLVRIIYEDTVIGHRKKVHRLEPMKVAAFNDCSMRALEGSDKLSQKKNWGGACKGISLQSFDIDTFSARDQAGNPTLVSRLWISSYLKRDEEIRAYTVSAPARNYLLFYDELLDWIVVQLNHQIDSDKWEDMYDILTVSDYPTYAWIALGAGVYTEWGEKNFLKRKDEAVVVIHDERVWPDGPPEAIVRNIFDESGSVPPGLCALHQTFV